MLIKEVPEQISSMKFLNIQELLTYVYDNQIITEFWELSEKEVTTDMKKKLSEAKKMKSRDFVNI